MGTRESVAGDEVQAPRPGTVSGTMTMDVETVGGEPWPLPPVDYVLYYLLADG